MDTKKWLSSLILSSLLAVILTVCGQWPAEIKGQAGSNPLPQPVTPSQEVSNLVAAGQYGLAKQKLLEATSHWQQIQRNDLAANALIRGGDSFIKIPRWQDALEFYQMALKIGGGSDQERARVLNSMGWIYYRLVHFDLAIDRYRMALETGQRIREHPMVIVALLGLAQIYADQSQIQQSIDCLAQAMSIDGPGVDSKIRAETFRFAARIYRIQGQEDQAQAVLERSLKVLTESREEVGEKAFILCDLSALALTSGKVQVAIERATEALTVSETFKRSDLKVASKLALARAQRISGRKEQALKSYYWAFSLTEMQATELSADPLKIGFMEDWQAMYRELADLQIELGHPEEAFNIVEHARARTILDVLSIKPEAQTPPRKPTESSSGLPLTRGGESIPADRGQGSASAQAPDGVGAKERNPEIQIHRLKRFTAPFSLAVVKQSTLKANEEIVEFMLGDKRSFVWLVTSDSTVLVELPSQKEIEDRVRTYLGVIAKRPANIYLVRDMAHQRVLAGQLVPMLFGQPDEKLNLRSRLIIIPDGLLSLLPFETLILDGKYLVEDHTLNYFPSASIFALARQGQINSKPSKQMELLAIGDPVLNGSSLLPGTRKEIMSISKLFAPRTVQVYLGKDATLETFKSEIRGGYRRIHLATHNALDEDNSTTAGIMFSLDRDPNRDNFLDISEIAELNLSGCELVVLSACQTGRGRLFYGEGTVNLARGFLCAGVHAVAVTLWNVNDAATADFMTRFYQHMVDRVDNAESLRLAKLEMINQGGAISHPYYWAPFVLIGDSV